MKKSVDRRILLAAVGVVIFVVLILVLPVPGTSEATDGDRLVVAVSIVPQAGFVEAIAGDRVEVLVMVPPGASPHTYEVTPAQMVTLSRAAMYVKVGSPVEFELASMDKLKAANPNMLVVDCSQGIHLLEMGEHKCDHDHDHDHGHSHDHSNDHDHDHTGLDPHIWLSVRNAKIMVQNICAALVQVDPDNSAYYEQNCADYLAELSELDEEIRDALADVENRRFIVYHPAWGYFAHDYDLVQIAVEQGGTEPSAQYMERLIDEAREHDTRVVFLSPQYRTRDAETIAREIGGRVVIINPLARDFAANMRDVVSAMKDAMQ